MVFSRNKTTAVLIHGIASAVLIKQPILSRLLILTNTGLNIYAHNFSKDSKFIKISGGLQLLTGFNIGHQTINSKQIKKGLLFTITSTLLDTIK